MAEVVAASVKPFLKMSLNLAPPIGGLSGNSGSCSHNKNLCTGFKSQQYVTTTLPYPLAATPTYSFFHTMQ